MSEPARKIYTTEEHLAWWDAFFEEVNAIEDLDVAEIDGSYEFVRLNEEEGAAQLAAVEEFLAAMRSAADEGMPIFERANLNREVRI